MKKSAKRVPDPLYKKFIEVMPVACVDTVVVHRGKFLLGKRVNKPAQGRWWTIGGRVLKGEKLEDAVMRHIKTETGIRKSKIKRLLAAKETMFQNSAQGPASHSINSIFLVEVLAPAVLPARGGENSDLRWFLKIEKNWHPYVRAALELAGFN